MVSPSTEIWPLPQAGPFYTALERVGLYHLTDGDRQRVFDTDLGCREGFRAEVLPGSVRAGCQAVG
ncbi:hypothetical protein, partial [Kitasatospora sp. NPDC058492]|uniref:hypothetical protein n=1 Tax=Kitasatospora sp. NPDC058492 TaxID=3346527 RepID=UPI00365517D3